MPFDTATMRLAPGEFDYNTMREAPPLPPEAPRGAIGEIVTGGKRGALVGLPSLVGNALKYISEPGQGVYDFGQGMVDSANVRAQRPDLQAQTEGRSGVTNALASGAEMLPSVLPLVAMGAGAATLGAPALAATGISAVAGGALFGAEAGQRTLEKGREAGLSEPVAREAARLNAGVTMAGQTALGMVGGQALGVVGKSLGRAVGIEGQALASGTLADLTGTSGVLKPFLKQMPLITGEAVATNAAQAAASAEIERRYGADTASPVDAALESVGPTLGLTAMMGPMALVSRAMGVRSAQQRTHALSNFETPPEIRTQLADAYAKELAKSDPEAAANFRANADTAIKNGLNLEVDSRLLDPNAVSAPEPEVPPAQLGYSPSRMYVFPDGTVSNSLADADAYIKSLPEDQQVAARAKLMGLGAEPTEAVAPPKPPVDAETADLHNQIRMGLQEAGVEPAAPLSRGEFGALEENAGKSAQEVAKSYRDYLNNPETQRDLMRRDADAYDKLQQEPAAPVIPDAPADTLAAQPKAAPAFTNSSMADALTAAFKKSDEDRAYAQREAKKQTETAAIANIAKGEQQAAAAEAGQITGDINAPKQRDAITADWKAAMEANDMDTKGQSLTPFMKRLDALGVMDMATHQEQIDALQTIIDDKKASQSMKDRASMLKQTWEAEMPAKVEEPARAAPELAVEASPEMAALRQMWPGLASASDAHVLAAEAWRKAEAGLKSRLGYGEVANAKLREIEDSVIEAMGGQPGVARDQVGYLTRLTEALNAASADAQAQLADPSTIAGRRRANEDQQRREESNQALHKASQEEIRLSLQQIAQLERQGRITKADLAELTRIAREAPDSFEIARALDDLMASKAVRGVEGSIKGEPAANAAALGENIPVSAPDNAAVPPKVAAAFEPLASNLEALGDIGVSRKADMIADRVAELRVQMNDRVRSGEKLSALEQERMDDLGDFARALTQFTEGRARPSDAHWINEMAKMVDEASQPYTESFRMVIPGLKVENPVTPDVGLLAPALASRKVADVMENLAANGSREWVKTLAARLQKLLPDTEIGLGTLLTDQDRAVGGLNVKGGVVAGEFIPAENRIDIYPRGATETTILHEAVHAATFAQIDRASAIKRPKGQEEARLVNAYKELEALREEVSSHVRATDTPDGGKHYGLTNAHEFVAELRANPEFQAFLRNTGGKQNNLWNRAVEAVRKLLGLPATETNVLSRAMTLSEEFFTDRQLTEMYDSGPKGAAGASDVALQRVIADGERRALVDTGRIDLGILRGVLPLQTVSYIANRMRALPEMVRSGFSLGVDAYQRANTSHEVVMSRLNDIGSRYVNSVEKMLRGMDGAKALGVQREMATIGGEASRIGFDYRKNGKDNMAADSTLTAADKPYMDEIHRRFTQLQKTNPEAARLLEEGERLNLQSLTQKTATILANLMDDYAGRARHLEAELARMTPTDADYARKQDLLKLATTEAVMAARHAKGLDLMDATLAEGKNGNPVRWADTSTFNLAQRMGAAMRDARTLPENSALRNAITAMESMYSAESKHPYFSLGRDGDFFVKVGFKGIDRATNERIQQALQGTNKIVGDLTRGDSSAYFRVKSADEAQALHDRLVAAGQGKLVDTAWGRQAERVSDVASVSPALRTLLSSVDDMRMDGLTPELRDQVKSQITRQLLSMLPETASRNASMGRRGTPGYDADFLQRFATRASGAAHDTASTYTSRAYMAAATQRSQALHDLNRTGSADARQRAQLVDDEINKRYSAMLQPVQADWVNKATSLSHSFYLGLSPANFIRAVAQPWHRGIPFIGSKFGFAQSMAELVKGQAVGMKMVAQSVAAATNKEGARGLLNAPVELQNLGLTPSEQAWVNEAHANGKLGLGESSQLMRAAMGEGSKLQDAMRYAAVNIQYAEMANRFGIGLAAFRLAEKRPNLLEKGETPSSYALRAMENAMDDFSPANTARAIGKHGFAGKMTPLFAQFQNYNLQTMQQIARTVHEGFFGQDKSAAGLQRSKEARREFAGLMATTATIAGAMGMPFANVFAGVYNTLMQDENKPEDVRVAMRNWAAGTFGKEFGNVIMKGLPSLLNVDTSTFGAQGILPGSDFLADRTLWKERSESQVRNSLGPAVSLGLDLTNAVSKMSDGYWMKGIEAALPVGLRSFYKTGAMIAGDGYYTDGKGNPTPMPITGSDIAWRALGFQTEDKATQGMAQRDFMINQQRLADTRKRIQDRFVKGSLDPANIPDAVQALQAYNQANPTQALTGMDIAGAVRNYHVSRALGEASGMGIPVSKRGYVALQESAPFAAMPSR